MTASQVATESNPASSTHKHTKACEPHCEDHAEDVATDSEDEHDDSAEGLNRGEKKARKVLGKLGLKAVEGVERVAMKRGRIVFAIAKPAVYRVGNTDCYVVFGEVKGEDTAAAFAAQRLAALRSMQAAASSAPADQADEEEDDGKDAASGSDMPDDKDVTIVMEQTSATRAAAIKALQDNGNDVVNAIMALSN